MCLAVQELQKRREEEEKLRKGELLALEQAAPPSDDRSLDELLSFIDGGSCGGENGCAGAAAAASKAGKKKKGKGPKAKAPEACQHAKAEMNGGLGSLRQPQKRHGDRAAAKQSQGKLLSGLASEEGGGCERKRPGAGSQGVQRAKQAGSADSSPSSTLRRQLVADESLSDEDDDLTLDDIEDDDDSDLDASAHGYWEVSGTAFSHFRWIPFSSWQLAIIW
jgi:hypothetical protein